MNKVWVLDNREQNYFIVSSYIIYPKNCENTDLIQTKNVNV